MATQNDENTGAQAASERERRPDTSGQGPLVDDHDLSHLELAALLNGYTNAAEQVDGVPPAASSGEHDNTADGLRHGRPAQTMEIAAELVAHPTARNAWPPAWSRGGLGARGAGPAVRATVSAARSAGLNRRGRRPGTR